MFCTRSFFRVALALVVVSPAAHAQPADAYPSKPVRIVVPFVAGGGTDLLARLFGPKMTGAMGQPVVIDNRAGGSTVIGSDLVAKSPPDGCTVLFTTNTHVVNPSLHPALPYETLRDFAPVSLLIESPNVLLVHPALPAHSVKELIVLAKAKPHQINYGSGGNGSIGQLSMELFKLTAGVDLVHIPYKSGGPAMNALLAGEVQVTFSNIFTTVPFVRAGRLRALGVSSRRRSLILPAVPTIAEAGVAGFEANAWYGAFAPARTPVAVVTRLNTEMVRILKLPDVRQRLADDGIQGVGNSPAEFAEVVRTDIPKWARVVQAAHIAAD